ncbi:hypothetical protein KKG71_04020 [Patescibacteria group bacterium]|nr:hypothetical protein [Patescibacteria group bacterium]
MDYHGLSFDEVVKNIKELNIQGAERIARSAVYALGLKYKEGVRGDDLDVFARQLKEARATEPALRNALAFFAQNERNKNIERDIMKHFEDAKTKIAEIGANKINDGMNVYTHCHSSTVEAVIVEAHKRGMKIKVHNTETRPRYQGRITAEKLAAAGIEVHHFVDSCMSFALMDVDLILFGADSISSTGQIINKIGTRTVVNLANQYRIPCYCCTTSWKFNPDTLWGHDEEIEQRDPKEVWADAPKGVVVHNPAFEVAPADKVTGIISELGVLKPETLVTAIKDFYPWLMKV